LAQNPDSQGLDIRDALAPEIPMSTFYDTLRRMRITCEPPRVYTRGI
jgi:hypothetical protein